MKTVTRRQHAEKHQDQETDKGHHRKEDLRRLQAWVRQRFQDTERMYHDVQEKWKNRRSAPTETLVDERVS